MVMPLLQQGRININQLCNYSLYFFPYYTRVPNLVIEFTAANTLSRYKIKERNIERVISIKNQATKMVLNIEILLIIRILYPNSEFPLDLKNSITWLVPSTEPY